MQQSSAYGSQTDRGTKGMARRQLELNQPRGTGGRGDEYDAITGELEPSLLFDGF